MSTPLPLVLLLLPRLVLAQAELPGPPAPDLTDPAEHADAVFGSDLGLTLGAGSLLGAWPVPGVHTSIGVRFDAFTVGVAAEGPRLGLSVFGEKALGLLPRAEESQGGEDQVFPFDIVHFGALCVLRPDPAVPWGGTAGLGFSRMDLEPYYGGSYPVPVMLFEGGARRHLGPPDARTFFDLGLRAGWAQVRGLSEQIEELWFLQLALGLGAHVR